MPGKGAHQIVCEFVSLLKFKLFKHFSVGPPPLVLVLPPVATQINHSVFHRIEHELLEV